jgi:START domain-containing protein
MPRQNATAKPVLRSQSVNYSIGVLRFSMNLHIDIQKMSRLPCGVYCFTLRASRMRKRVFALATVAMLRTAGLAAANAPTDSAWQKLVEEDGIAVFGREVAGASLLAMRGEGVVDAPLLRVASVLIDTSRAHEWVDSVAETRTLRKVSDSEYVQWNHVATPWVLKDRDFVFTTKLELSPKVQQVALNYHSVSDPAAPKTDYVRGQFIYGKFVLASIDGGRKTRVLAELLCDPKGSVAKWMVNLVQKDWPHSTIVRLRRQVAKPNVVDSPKLAQAMKVAGY